MTFCMAVERLMYLALVVLKMTCDSNLAAHDFGQLANAITKTDIEVAV